VVISPAYTAIESGTEFVDGVRYNTYPPPDGLVKVMKRCLAEYLLSEGAMRFGSLAYYRKLGNPVLGDSNDGEGMLRWKEHPYEVGSMNPVYAWCAALPTINPERVNLLAEHEKYDCLVRINQPRVLIQRVRAALLAKGRNLLLHCAEVSYNRGEEVNKVTLNSQKFHFNVFQKDASFAEDKEYRISLTDAEFRPELSHIDLQVVKCTDIMEIEELPN
jgi:hypothetical protein